MLRRDWTVPAATQLAHAQDHYHALNPTAAAAMARQVREATRTLAEQPGRVVPAGLQVPANGR